MREYKFDVLVVVAELRGGLVGLAAECRIVRNYNARQRRKGVVLQRCTKRKTKRSKDTPILDGGAVIVRSTAWSRHCDFRRYQIDDTDVVVGYRRRPCCQGRRRPLVVAFLLLAWRRG